MDVFFTRENTKGFSQADLMNEAVEILVSKDKDSDPKYIEMLKDLVNDRFFEGCKLTDLTYTEGWTIFTREQPAQCGCDFFFLKV